MDKRQLNGCSVLIIEDEVVILMDLQAIFEDAGARVIPVSRLGDALALSDTEKLHAAVIDFGLGSDDGGAVCCHLAALGIPFVFHSGSDRQTVSPWPDAPFVSKPACPEDLLQAVASVISHPPHHAAEVRQG